MTIESQSYALPAIGELESVRAALDGINFSSDRVASSLSRAFANAIVSGKSLNEVLGSVALSLSKMALNASFKSMFQGLSSLVGSTFGSFFGGGGAPVAPFADGGIVSRPTFFGTRSGLGLMGERGAEAILPLARGADGRLGVASAGDQGRAVAINVTIAAQDVESFRRSEVQISSALARAVMRGRRGL